MHTSVHSYYSVERCYLVTMCRKNIFLLVVFAILALVGAASVIPGGKAQKRKARRELRDCIFDILLSNLPNRTCETKEDFINLSNKYIELEDKSNMSIHLNRRYADILLFTINHPNVKDFMQHSECVNTTGCEIKEYGLTVDLNKDYSHKNTNRTNIINQLFRPSEEPQYDERKCDRNKSMLKCVESESLQKCDNNTKTFVLDIFKYSIKPCDNIKPFHVGANDGAVSLQLTPTTFLISLILTVLCLMQ